MSDEINECVAAHIKLRHDDDYWSISASPHEIRIATFGLEQSAKLRAALLAAVDELDADTKTLRVKLEEVQHAS